jgi:hypothetical protein
MHVVVTLGKMKSHFTGVMKTPRGLFPKAFLQESLVYGTCREQSSPQH